MCGLYGCCSSLGHAVRVDVPFGFERIEGDLNHNRSGAPYIALCVQRDASKAPITDITVVTQAHDAAVCAFASCCAHAWV